MGVVSRFTGLGVISETGMCLHRLAGAGASAGAGAGVGVATWLGGSLFCCCLFSGNTV